MAGVFDGFTLQLLEAKDSALQRVLRDGERKAYIARRDTCSGSKIPFIGRSKYEIQIFFKASRFDFLHSVDFRCRIWSSRAVQNDDKYIVDGPEGNAGYTG